MASQANPSAKALTGTLLSVVGWVVIYFTISHWWTLSTSSERIVGAAGLVGGEVVRTAPTLVYFFAIGMVFGHIMGASSGAKWAVLGAAVSMCVYALLSQQVFLGAIDPLAVVVLVVNFLLPLLCAGAGAAATRTWHRSQSGSAAT
jgi:hypothetical protein